MSVYDDVHVVCPCRRQSGVRVDDRAVEERRSAGRFLFHSVLVLKQQINTMIAEYIATYFNEFMIIDVSIKFYSSLKPTTMSVGERS